MSGDIIPNAAHTHVRELRHSRGRFGSLAEKDMHEHPLGRKQHAGDVIPL